MILKVLPLKSRPRGESSALFNCYFCCFYCHNVEDSMLYRVNDEYSMIAVGLVRTLFDANRMTQKMLLCS